MPTADSCPSPDELPAQLAGPLPTAKREALAAHLESCPRCRDAAELLLAREDPRPFESATRASALSHPARRRAGSETTIRLVR